MPGLLLVSEKGLIMAPVAFCGLAAKPLSTAILVFAIGCPSVLGNVFRAAIVLPVAVETDVECIAGSVIKSLGAVNASLDTRIFGLLRGRALE